MRRAVITLPSNNKEKIYLSVATYQMYLRLESSRKWHLLLMAYVTKYMETVTINNIAPTRITSICFNLISQWKKGQAQSHQSKRFKQELKNTFRWMIKTSKYLYLQLIARMLDLLWIIQWKTIIFKKGSCTKD